MSKFLKRVHFYRPWHTPAWNRGHQAGYRKAMENLPRDMEWLKHLEKYYYRHINNCIKKRCTTCSGEK